MKAAPINAALVCCLLRIFTAPPALAQQTTSSAAPHKSAADSAHATAPKRTPLPAAKLTEEQRALHALNRLTFGPWPGDLQKVMNTDVNDWIEQQLHPPARRPAGGGASARRSQAHPQYHDRAGDWLARVPTPVDLAHDWRPTQRCRDGACPVSVCGVRGDAASRVSTGKLAARNPA